MAWGIQAGKLSIKIVQYRSDFIEFHLVLSTLIVREMKERFQLEVPIVRDYTRKVSSRTKPIKCKVRLLVDFRV